MNNLLRLVREALGLSRDAAYEGVLSLVDVATRMLLLVALPALVLGFLGAFITPWIPFIVSLAMVGAILWIATSTDGLWAIAFVGAADITASAVARIARKLGQETTATEVRLVRGYVRFVLGTAAAVAGLLLLLSILPVTSLNALVLLLFAILVITLTAPKAVKGVPWIRTLSAFAMMVGAGSISWLLYLGVWGHLTERFPEHSRALQSLVILKEASASERARENEARAAAIFREVTEDTWLFQLVNETELEQQGELPTGTVVKLYRADQKLTYPDDGSEPLARVVVPAGLPGVFVPGIAEVGYVPWRQTKPWSPPFGQEAPQPVADRSETLAETPQPVAAAATSPSPLAALPAESAGFVTRSATRHGANAGLMAAICLVESGCRLDAPRGSAGEVCAMQILPETAARYGVSPGQLQEPQVCFDVAARHIAYLEGRYPGRTDLVALAYNAGEATADRYTGMSWSEVSPGEVRGVGRGGPYDAHTYVNRVLELLAQQQAGPMVVAAQQPAIRGPLADFTIQNWRPREALYLYVDDGVGIRLHTQIPPLVTHRENDTAQAAVFVLKDQNGKTVRYWDSPGPGAVFQVH